MWYWLFSRLREFTIATNDLSLIVMENPDNKTAGSGETLPLITPRHSLVGENEAEAPKETPHASVRVVQAPTFPNLN